MFHNENNSIVAETSNKKDSTFSKVAKAGLPGLLSGIASVITRKSSGSDAAAIAAGVTTASLTCLALYGREIFSEGIKKSQKLMEESFISIKN